jgi:hypothetical protein
MRAAVDGSITLPFSDSRTNRGNIKVIIFVF